MSRTMLQYPGSRAHRGFSADLWGKILRDFAPSAGSDPYFGKFEFTDCNEEFANPGDAAATAIDNPWWVQDLTDGGTVESLAKNFGSDYYTDFGVWTLGATTGTDDFGISMHRGLTATTGAELQFPSNNVATAHEGRYVCMEFLVDVDDTPCFFVGAAEPIAEFLDSDSALPQNSDYIGFFKADDTEALTFAIFNDNGGGTAVGVTATILANADIPNNDWLKLGFRVDRLARTVDVAVDGVLYQSGDLTWTGTIATTDKVEDSLPIERLARRIDISRAKDSDPATISIDIDWMALFVGGEADII